jgi:hypothetical protein
MNEMTVTVLGHAPEAACRMMFGTNAELGPVTPVPEPLLLLLDHWPMAVDDVIDVAMALPQDFNVEKVSLFGRQMAVQLRLCRVTVLNAKGERLGYALRTDEAGLNAIELWRGEHERHLRRIRQAH